MEPNENNIDIYGEDDTIDQLVDEMYRAASRGIGDDDAPATHRALDAIVVLSAVLSGIFFLLYGRQVFGTMPAWIAFVLALVCGLLPTEYAYIAWRKVRRVHDRMTKPQLWASGLGITFAVGFAIFSTMAMFIAGFPRVPADIRAYADWFVFVALTFPLPIQFALVAVFELSDRVIIENYTRARTHAIKFSAIQYFDVARVGAAMLGMKRRLARQLKPYGAAVGSRYADQMLGRAPTHAQLPAAVEPGPAAAPTLSDADVDQLLDPPSLVQRVREKITGRRPDSQPGPSSTPAEADDTPTHDAPRHAFDDLTPAELRQLVADLASLLQSEQAPGGAGGITRPPVAHANGKEEVPSRPQ